MLNFLKMFGLVRNLLKYRSYLEPALQILEALGGLLDGRITGEELDKVVERVYDANVLPNEITERAKESEIKEAIKYGYLFVKAVQDALRK